LFPTATARANAQEIDDETHLLVGEGAANNKQSKHCLDSAKRTQGAGPVEDVKSLVAVLIVLLPAPLFWSLSDQQSSKWVFQGSTMDRKMPWWIGGFVVEEDQMQALNPVLVLGMIPIFYEIIYPFCEKRGWSLKPVRRMWLGIAFSSAAFVISALVQIVIDSRGIEESQISILWQTPQYIIVTAGEVLFSITGLEFAYSEAPESMKSVVQAVWLFTVAGGNLVTVIIIAAIGDRLSAANEYFVFSLFAAIAVLLMIWLGSGFDYKHQRQPSPDTDESP
jgi:dipeptide/tripeptide permease